MVTITPEQAAQDQARRREYQEKRDRWLRLGKPSSTLNVRPPRSEAAEARRQAWAWFNRVVIRFGWFRALPETARPIVVGLAVALPVIGMIVVFFGR